MPTVTLNRKEVETILGKKLSDDVLKDRISMLGTDLESLTKDSIEVEIFPNRPDMLSEQGFGRALASFIGTKPGLREYKINTSSYTVTIDPTVKKVRPHTSCAVVKGLQLTDEKIRQIIQIQEKLHITYGRNRAKVAIGVYPCEKIAFPITFFGAKPRDIQFTPLGLQKELTALQILSQHPAGRNYGHLLEGEKIFPFFKDAKNNILSMPPIINSEHVGRVDETTTEVFIECSGFDYEVLHTCLIMIVTALADMGGKIYSVTLHDGKKKTVSPDIRPQTMKLDINYLQKRLGITLSKKEIEKLLKKMGYGIQKDDVLIPAYRADILHPIDLVEDIAIAYGYENFKPIIPKVATVGNELPLERLKKTISELLIGLGCQEVYTYSIINAEFLKTTGFDTRSVTLANSLSEEYNVMRTSLIPSLLSTLKTNRNHEYPQQIFDMGIAFSDISDTKKLQKDSLSQTHVAEQERLCIALCGEKIGFTNIKQIVNYIMKHFNTTYTLKEKTHTCFLEGRVGTIHTSQGNAGIMGEVNPFVLESFGLEYPVSIVEIDLQILYNLINEGTI